MYKKIATYLCMILVGVMGLFMNLNYNNKQFQIDGVILVNAECLTGSDGVRRCSGGTTAAEAAAAASTNQSQIEKAIQEFLNTLIAGLNIFLAVLTIFVTPAIMFAGWLMSPDWTSGDLFGIRPIMHSLWITISNITYFIYAILLIVIALATIYNSDNYGYKQLLPRLALGIIMVPLTWWFIQFTISLASIVTASVMTLPAETMNEYQAKKEGKNSWWTTPVVPKKIEFNNKAGLKNQIETINCAVGSGCLSAQAILGTSAGMYSPLLIYGYGIFKLDKVKELTIGWDLVSSPIQIIHQGLIAVIMFLVFGLLVLALVFMLIMRAVKLWMYAIFSPFMTLKYVLGDKLFGKEGGDSFEIKEFIGLAFVPAVVGLCLSFGIVILSLMQSSNITGQETCTPDKIKSPEGCKIITIMGNASNSITRKLEEDLSQATNNLQSVYEVTIGGMTLRYVGNVVGASDIDKAVSGANSSTGVLSSAGGIFGTIIIDIMALVFIWLAFMAAKSTTKVAQAAFEPFESLGKKFGGIAKTGYQHIPILPGGLSVNSAKRVMTNAEVAMQKADENRFNSSFAGKLFGGDKNVPQSTETEYKDALGKWQSKKDKLAKANGEAAARENYIHSEIPKQMIKKLEELKGQTTVQLEFLKANGYSDDNARKILDLTHGRDLYSYEALRARSDFVSAIKSAQPKEGGGPGGGNNGFKGSLNGTNLAQLDFKSVQIFVDKGKSDDETKINVVNGIVSQLKALKDASIKINEDIISNMLAPILGTERARKIAPEIIKDSRIKDIVGDPNKDSDTTKADPKP